ncbi:MAG: ATP-binding protein [Clostridiales bacterium]|nr:ATP-binding protein [Clostridiales bacterium]
MRDMVQADLVKKLLSSFKSNDKEGFIRAANEVIGDERKKNHHALADEMQSIINRGAQFPSKDMATLMASPGNSKVQPLLFQIIYPDKPLSHVVLSPVNKVKIEQIIREFHKWDLLKNNGVDPIRTALFYGPPGCGKTFTAQAIATEIEVPLLYVRFDAIVSSYLGETSGNIRKVFDYASNDRFVILFDEFDAIARSRNDQYEHGEIKRVVNAFLQQIDNFNSRSIIIAATNFEQSLDYAIWRRFDTTLKFDMPSDADRKYLFRLNIRRFAGAENAFDVFLPEMSDFTHNDVERIAVEVAKKLLIEGRKMYTKEDVEQAFTHQKELVSLRRTQYDSEG